MISNRSVRATLTRMPACYSEPIFIIGPIESPSLVAKGSNGEREEAGMNAKEAGELAHTSRACKGVAVSKYTEWRTSVWVYFEVHGVCVRSPELNDTSLYTKKASAFSMHVDVYVPEPPSQDNIAVASQHTREFKAGHALR